MNRVLLITVVFDVLIHRLVGMLLTNKAVMNRPFAPRARENGRNFLFKRA